MAFSIWKPFAAIARCGALALLALSSQAGDEAMAQEPTVIVAFGDSLTAGYQLPPDAAFPVQLEKALTEKGHNVRVANSGVSGDTSADGLARFDWAMPEDADAVILELGANDSLRGIAVEETRKALGEILKLLKDRNIPVLIAGMEAPRNWGDDYVAEFRQMYADLAAEYGADLYPFFLDGIALDNSLNLGDGLHPNEKGVGVIVERILPKVEELIEKAESRPAKES
jgi:acyl-CoA thioesterase-1